MNWTKLEGACLEQLLVDPAALHKVNARLSWEGLLLKAARRKGWPEADVATYHRWASDMTQHREAAKLSPVWALMMASGRRMLTFSGRQCVLRDHPREPGLERIVWRWVSAAVPPLSLCAATAPDIPIWETVQVLSPVMAPQQPVAVLHVHHGQLLDYESLWRGLVIQYSQRGVLADNHGKRPILECTPPPGCQTTKRRAPTGEAWERILLACFATRLALSRQVIGVAVPSALVAAADQFGRGQVLLRSDFHWAAFRRYHFQYFSALESVSEARFQVAMFQRLNQGLAQYWEAASFENYLRVRAILYAHLVHRQGEIGLSDFVSHSSATDPYEYVAREERDAGMETDQGSLTVGALEARCPPTSWIKRQPHRYFPARPYTVATANAKRGPTKTKVESAWIISFDRCPGKDRLPSRKPGKVFDPAHVHAWRGAETGATRILQMLRAYPRTLRSTRGLDVMGLEKEGPLWVVLPALLKVREAANRIAAKDGRPGVVPLRTTIHAGEDSDYLLTGLRQISEPLFWGMLQRGDRLGHATAIGIDPEAWALRHSAARCSWWDRFLDVGWATECFHQCKLTYTDSLAGLAEDARTCLQEMTKHTATFREVPIELARKLWIKLGQRDTLLRLRYPCRTTPQIDEEDADRLLRHYLFNDEWHWRARAREYVADPARDLPVMQTIHRELRRRLGRLQITIEVQPSSNLFVGGVDALLDQPFFQSRAAVDRDGDDVLPIAISSDDPLAFATTTADEYGYAWAGLVAAGRPPSLATRWLEESAENSMRARFTDPSSPQWADDPWRT